MGVKESKLSYLTYEDAIKRVKEDEIKRLRLAFRRASGTGGFMPRQTFGREIFGDFIPPRVLEQIFLAFGGSVKGISFKDLVCGLVLLTRGTREEKVKFIFSVYSSDGTFIYKEEIENTVFTCDGGGNSGITFGHLFSQSDQASIEEFDEWLKSNTSCTTLTKWLLENENSGIIDLGTITETPTFYQTLAGVTKLTEDDVIALEKKYWMLKAISRTGKFDFETLSAHVSPPIPKSLSQGLFNAFDENKDGNIDFREIACGISACCKGSQTDRQEFCFKIFDIDQDGLLNQNEIDVMVDAMLVIWSENPSFSKVIVKDKEKIIKELLEDYDSDEDGCITLGEYQHWALVNQLPQFFLKILFQVCHIVLGLKPATRDDEAKVISGWLERDNSRGLRTGDTWYLISMSWWKNWRTCVCYQTSLRRSSTSNIRRNGTIPYRNNSTSPLANHAWVDVEGPKSEVLRRESHPAFGSSSKVISSDTSVMNGQAKSDANGGPVMTTPGQIDNNSLIEPETRKVMILTSEGGKLKRNTPLVCGRDFEIVPDPVWKALVQWYNGGPALPRLVIMPTHPDATPELELYPVSLRLFRHVQPPVRTSPISMFNNMSFGIGNWTLGNSLTNPLAPPKRYLAYLATFSKMNTIQQVFEFLCTRLRLKPEDMRLWNILEENNQYIMEEDSKQTLEALKIKDNFPILIEVRNRDMSWPEEMSSLTTNKTLKERSNSVPTEKGTTGLNNLGNTCFMNSALQCMSNTQPLTIYFNREYHLYEVNKTNPHGMKGNMAKRYGDLVQDLWSGNNRTIVPLRLRYTIGRCAPRFSGCQQHDSQEFLSFLLDGLHEDLNRVHEKPYIELKDSDGRPDEVVAQEAWENHLKRNQSIIVDLFQGQLKSQVKCLECDHASVRFDPFTFLSLPLPMDSSILLEITVVRLDGSVPVRYGLLLNTDDKYRSLKKELSQHCQIDPTQILLVEMAESTFKNLPADSQKIRSVLGGNLFAYEIPHVNSDSHSNNCLQSNGESNDIAEENDKIHRENSSKDCSKVNISVTVEEADVPANKNSEKSLGSNASEKSVDSQKKDLVNDSTNELIVEQRDLPGLNDSGKRKRCQSPVNNGTKNDYKVGPLPKKFNNNPSPKKKFSGISFDSLLRTNVLKTMDNNSMRSPRTSGNSRNTSTSSDLDFTAGGSNTSSLDKKPPFRGFVVALHRRQIPIDTFFVSTQKNQPCLFGVPVVVPCDKPCKHVDMYESIWKQVSRLISAPSPGDADLDSSSQYPFELKLVQKDGLNCALCPWYRFCRGCTLKCDNDEFEHQSSYIAVDWEPKTLHLRYQSSQEKVFTEDESIERSRKKQTEPIDLYECLQAFTKEEELGEDELWYCSKCKKHRLASKKLDIWSLPPLLIIHLKRFQFVTGNWVKSNKVVNFPMIDFDPSAFLVQRCRSAGSIRSHTGIDLESNNTTISTVSQRSSECRGSEGSIEEGIEETEHISHVSNTTTEVQSIQDPDTARGGNKKSTTKKSSSDSKYKDVVNDDSAHSSSGSLNSIKSTTSRHSSHSSLNKVHPEILDETANTTISESTSNSKVSEDGNSRVFSQAGSSNTLESGHGTDHGQTSSTCSSNRGTQSECLPSVSVPSTESISPPKVSSPKFHKCRRNSHKAPKYDLYAVSSHSGLLGGGHYISYAHNPNNKWYCYNDSSCKECDSGRVKNESPYMLFYELQGLDYPVYLPNTNGKTPDTVNDEDDLEETKKSCRLQ